MSDTKSVVRSVDGWLRTRPGEQCLIRVPTAETGGIYSVVEIISDPGDATPLHVHRNEDEYFVILEGVARIACGDRVMDARPGDAIMLPRQLPHAWGNRSDRQLSFFVAIVFPGGVQEAMRVIAAGGVKDLPALAESFGVTALPGRNRSAGKPGAVISNKPRRMHSPREWRRRICVIAPSSIANYRETNGHER